MLQQQETFERINEYSSVQIRLASSEVIRSWSYGEVKKPETINYRTYRAERDGLFCERIFGPEKDWECFCGKYKGIKHKGIICDRCGVKVTHSRVRRKRMGHITLAAPVVHIWFFKSVPSRLGTLLAMKMADLERVIYYQDYAVVDPGETPLKACQLLTEEEYRQAQEKYGATKFRTEMGAEAIRQLLRRIDLKKLARDLRAGLAKTSSKQKIRDIANRLKLVDSIIASENQPDWVIMDVVPVIPPDLRPLVFLESGNFATSDLNDLYRRVINRNNRLKKLIDLNAPEVIIRNEKRMLQQAVDALFDNTRSKRPLIGSNNRPLKSLTDMIKGKQGRFRENLLGKRVDYSARSVIVVGPELKLHQCGLPKKIALELFQPFIIRRLKEKGLVDTIKSAKRMLERRDDVVWDVLDEVIQRHPVLLNRAPTLHRMGIQAFEPVLVEGNAIRIHPLVCHGFNADFDGDTMSVHLPLSIEAQIEASTLMLSVHNIFSPAHGNPIMTPSQEMVLGSHYLTSEVEGEKGEGKAFSDFNEAIAAFSARKISMHTRIRVRMCEGRRVVGEHGIQEPEKGGRYVTTVGRILFNDILPAGLPFYNLTLGSKNLSAIIAECHTVLGRDKTLGLLDSIKEMGFKSATRGGLSFSIHDLKKPKRKIEILKKAEGEVAKIEKGYERGIITEGERYNQVVDCWTHAREQVWEEVMTDLKNDIRDGKRYLNPIYMMTISGARGGIQQIGQLAGMRGLMAKPSGRIIENPIRANFREGLSVFEYFSSTHGSRKGLADTALKTAESGYLTRKMADVAQNVVVMEEDCQTPNGITKGIIYQGDKVVVPMWRAVYGRTACDTVVDKQKKKTVVKENNLITKEAALEIEALGYEKIRVRSPMTCDSAVGVCAACYGMDLSSGKCVELGTAVGIVAAQSIGEPGTQLTMKTFHIGGIGFVSGKESEARTKKAGVVRYHGVNVAQKRDGTRVVLNRNGELVLYDAKTEGALELERYPLPAGALLKVADGDKVVERSTLAIWDPHMVPILTEKAGKVRFDDIQEGETYREEIDKGSGRKRKVIVEHKGDLHPQVVIVNPRNEKEVLGLYPLPEKAHIEVEEGDTVDAGSLLAKTPREISGTQDITGGLPRVTELLEARKPKDPSIISEIDGVVQIGDKKRGKRTIIVKNESGMEVEHLVPHGKHLTVNTGDRVRAGDKLVDGPVVPQDILRISGEEAVQQYLIREVQGVYRSQNVQIDDKHIETIVAQMMLRVRVEESGDSDFLPGSVVTKAAFRAANDKVRKSKGKPATAKPLLLGITKAALHSDSFLSAASFQDTTKVLTEAALAGKVDRLQGLKENVILGHMIPAGTGFWKYREGELKLNVTPTELKKAQDLIAQQQAALAAQQQAQQQAQEQQAAKTA